LKFERTLVPKPLWDKTFEGTNFSDP